MNFMKKRAENRRRQGPPPGDVDERIHGWLDSQPESGKQKVIDKEKGESKRWK